MEIAIISDTHGYLDNKIWKHLNAVDEIWHAGDVGNPSVIDDLEKLKKPIRGVYGNIDGTEVRKRFPETQLFECEDLTVGMMHIAGYPGTYNKYASSWLNQNKPDLFICGHSHILKVQRDLKRGHLHLNPGACGKHGFHKIKTLLLLEIKEGKPQNLRVVELGPRAELPNSI